VSAPNHTTVSLDNETHRMLMRRAEQCEGNASKAMRSFILESSDTGMRVRRAIRPDLDIIHRTLGIVRKSDRVPGSGILIEQIDAALKSIEEKVARVTTT